VNQRKPFGVHVAVLKATAPVAAVNLKDADIDLLVIAKFKTHASK
jgi:uncharacterized protein YccT (UPF0319 family)